MKKLFVGLSLLLMAGVSGFAQETETRVVDEVVAQVNDGVITLSRVKREVKDAVDSLVQQGKTREEAQKIVNDKQGEMIATLINEELLMQKAKEMGLEKDIDVAVNERIAEIMKQYGLKTVEAMNAEMEKQGIDPADFRSNLVHQVTRDRVLQQELQAKVYWAFNGKELKDYFDTHKDKFTQPETISFSELFLGFAGRDEAAVREKAKQLYAQLRAGGDWKKIVEENSDPGVVTQGTGKAEKVNVSDLPKLLSENFKGLKVGEYTAPFDGEQLGVIILRVDAREQASAQSVYNEPAIRMAMMNERLPKEQEKFFSKLRAEAYIKINETYRPMVSPILFADERKDKSN